MDYQHILYAEGDGIGRLTLNLLAKRNALSRACEEEIIACLEDATARYAAKVIILAGAGELFCAGHDRGEILGQPAGEIHRLFHT